MKLITSNKMFETPIFINQVKAGELYVLEEPSQKRKDIVAYRILMELNENYANMVKQYNTKQENDIYFFTFQKTFSAVVERYVSYVKKLNIENPMNRFLYILLAETATEYLNIVKRYNFMNMALNEEQTYSIDNDGNNVKDLIYGIYVTPENKIENSRTLQYENYKTLGIVNHYKTKNQNKLTA